MFRYWSLLVFAFSANRPLAEVVATFNDFGDHFPHAFVAKLKGKVDSTNCEAVDTNYSFTLTVSPAVLMGSVTAGSPKPGCQIYCRQQSAFFGHFVQSTQNICASCFRETEVAQPARLLNLGKRSCILPWKPPPLNGLSVSQSNRFKKQRTFCWSRGMSKGAWAPSPESPFSWSAVARCAARVQSHRSAILGYPFSDGGFQALTGDLRPLNSKVPCGPNSVRTSLQTAVDFGPSADAFTFVK
jgi:hypothetical protein